MVLQSVTLDASCDDETGQFAKTFNELNRKIIERTNVLEKGRVRYYRAISGLLDINLPGMDGYEALSRLRNYPETSHIPVVAVSAAAMAGDIERGQKAGFKH